MPKISTKAIEMPSSPIRKLVPFAEAAKKRGTKIYHLNIGQPDIETPPSFLNAVKNADVIVEIVANREIHEMVQIVAAALVIGFIAN